MSRIKDVIIFYCVVLSGLGGVAAILQLFDVHFGWLPSIPWNVKLMASIFLYIVTLGGAIYFRVTRIRPDKSLAILAATWGNAESRIPVERALNRRPRNGLFFYLNHEAFPACGDDPAPGDDRKYVEIEYRLPGRPPAKVRRVQGSWVVLPEDRQHSEGHVCYIAENTRLDLQETSFNEIGGIGMVEAVFANYTALDIPIWTPLWENSTGCVACPEPFTADLGEQITGANDKAWHGPKDCIVVKVGQKFSCRFRLLQPTGDGIKVRLNARNTGTLVFPIKFGGKLQYQKVRI